MMHVNELLSSLTDEKPIGRVIWPNVRITERRSSRTLSSKFWPPKNMYLKWQQKLEKSVKYAKSQQWRHQNDIIDVVLLSLLLTLNTFRNFF